MSAYNALSSLYYYTAYARCNEQTMLHLLEEDTRGFPLST